MAPSAWTARNARMAGWSRPRGGTTYVMTDTHPLLPLFPPSEMGSICYNRLFLILFWDKIWMNLASWCPNLRIKSLLLWAGEPKSADKELKAFSKMLYPLNTHQEAHITWVFWKGEIYEIFIMSKMCWKSDVGKFWCSVLSITAREDCFGKGAMQGLSRPQSDLTCCYSCYVIVSLKGVISTYGSSLNLSIWDWSRRDQHDFPPEHPSRVWGGLREGFNNISPQTLETQHILPHHGHASSPRHLKNYSRDLSWLRQRQLLITL